MTEDIEEKREEERRRRQASLRTIVGLAAVGTLAQLGWSTMCFSALPVWVTYDLREGTKLGLILSTFMLTEALLRPSLGALSDRIGRKPLMLIGPLLGIFTSILTIHTKSIAVMVILRAIDGVGLAAFWPAAFAAASDAVEEERRSTAMGVLNSCSMAGIALGFPLGGIANELYRSHAGSFVLVCGIFTVAFLVGLFVFPRVPHRCEVQAAEPEHHLDRMDVRSAISMVPDMLVLSIVVFAAIGLLMPVVKLYAMEQLGLSETKFGAVVFPIAAVLGVLAVPFGRLADQLGKLVSFCYGLLICTAAMWIIAVCRNILAAGAAGAILGVGFALAFPAWMAVVSQASPSSRRGQVMGVVGLAQGVGAIIGTSLGPVIYSSDWLSLPRLGVMDRNMPFYLCAMLLSVGSIIAFTWIARLRSIESNGRAIMLPERRAVISVAMVGVMVIAGWVVFRFTRPLPPDRVAWLWTQAAVRGEPERAKHYTEASFETPNSDGMGGSDMAAAVYHRWTAKEKAYYIPPKKLVISKEGDEAQVTLVFRFLDSEVRECIFLVRDNSGEWRVSDRKGARAKR